jgi:hypothetical protein
VQKDFSSFHEALSEMPFRPSFNSPGVHPNQIIFRDSEKDASFDRLRMRLEDFSGVPTSPSEGIKIRLSELRSAAKE